MQAASVAISRDGSVIAERINTDQYEHASYVQPAILELCTETGLAINEFHAVAVVNGPGSYTGLRVGLASAKGICFASQIPLICINTLEWMASSYLNQPDTLVCPMIDARRDEVFTGLYDSNGSIKLAPQAMILDEEKFSAFLDSSNIFFVGDGAEKWKKITHHPNAHFPPSDFRSTELAKLSLAYFFKSQFSDLAYAEPFYTKEFYTTQIR